MTQSAEEPPGDTDNNHSHLQLYFTLKTRRQGGNSVNVDTNDFNDDFISNWSIGRLFMVSVFFENFVVSTPSMRVLVLLPVSCPHCGKQLAHLRQKKQIFLNQKNWKVASQALL